MVHPCLWRQRSGCRSSSCQCVWKSLKTVYLVACWQSSRSLACMCVPPLGCYRYREVPKQSYTCSVWKDRLAPLMCTHSLTPMPFVQIFSTDSSSTPRQQMDFVAACRYRVPRVSSCLCCCLAPLVHVSWPFSNEPPSLNCRRSSCTSTRRKRQLWGRRRAERQLQRERG